MGFSVISVGFEFYDQGLDYFFSPGSLVRVVYTWGFDLVAYFNSTRHIMHALFYWIKRIFLCGSKRTGFCDQSNEPLRICKMSDGCFLHGNNFFFTPFSLCYSTLSQWGKEFYSYTNF